MKKALILILCSVTAALSCRGNFNVTAVDPLVKVFPADTVYTAVPNEIEVAGGENACFQFVVWDDSQDLSDVRIESVKTSCKEMKVRTTGFIGYVRSLLDYDQRDPEALLPADRRYPDPVITDSLLFIPKGERRCFWVDIDVPAGTEAGSYPVKVKFRSSRGSVVSTVKIKVYGFSLDPQSLLVTNWMWLRPEFINKGVDVSRDSSLWWEWYGDLIKMGSDYGSNCWRLDVMSARPSDDGKSIVYDFSDFDRTVEFIMEHGSLKQIHGEHIGAREGGWISRFVFNCPVLENGKVTYKPFASDAPEFKEFISSYFPVLVAHLKEKKLPDGRPWLDIYAQFIADEPIDCNLEDWENAARIIKQAAPEIKIIEAYRASRRDRSLIDYPCPQEDELFWHDCFHNLERSDSVWMYTCMYPREKYPNRFLDQLLIKTRLVHWINYSFNCIGYLHWGFNYWIGPVKYWKTQGVDTTPLDLVSTNEWPGGDSHIIYPGYRKNYPSIRLCTMRDGIRDYELLRMIEKRDSSAARDFSGQIISGLQDYVTDVARFRQVRHDMLEYLSNNK